MYEKLIKHATAIYLCEKKAKLALVAFKVVHVALGCSSFARSLTLQV